MIKLKPLLRAMALIFATVSLAGCQWALLNPKGVIAAQEKDLLVEAVLLMLIIVIPVILMSFIIGWRYRAKNSKAKYSPNWAHNNWLEAACWTLPVIIIIILAVMTWVSTHALDPYKPLDPKTKPVTIQAIALDWKWLFIYPDQHIATVNYIQIPVHQPIKFEITSDAPMNSLEIPQLAGQIYAMTGMRTKLYFNANTAGNYAGLSTNYSGAGFSNMTFKVKATSQQAFSKWVQSVKTGHNPLTSSVYQQLTRPSEKDPAVYFSSVPHGLFNQVIMKYMGPDMPSMSS
jgi:cytochrome o ubiquinol oxidase subunit 2